MDTTQIPQRLWVRPALVATAAVLVVVLCSAHADAQEAVVPGATKFTDCDGRAQTPLAQPGKKATVLLFVLPDCPISNAYAPEIKRIFADYEAKKVAFFVVHADPDVTAEQAKKHAKEYGLPCPVLRDPKHVLVKHAGVTRAPEVAVIGPDQKVLYRGRIDDWYVDYGKRRAEPTRRDLRLSLDAILRGDAVANPTTEAIGCFLPEPLKQKSERTMP